MNWRNTQGTGVGFGGILMIVMLIVICGLAWAVLWLLRHCHIHYD